MTATTARPQSQKRHTLVNVVLQLAAMVAIGLLVYPDAANWVNSIGHNSEISGYVREVESTPSEERERILDAAYAYNDQLEPGPLTDPYISMSQDAQERSKLYQAYEEMLRVSGTDAIGTLNFPAVNIALPIFHGTSEEAISQGVGHMYGTSLPVGGPSTRSVLTAHSGLPHAALFTPLHAAKVGDTFWISVLGEDHHYIVREIEMVEPGNTESLRIIEGEDWVTLFTCTPVGVNSHRLLVHAERIPDADAGPLEQTISGDGVPLGFPWWAVWFVGGSALIAWILFVPPRKKSRKRPLPSAPESPSGAPSSSATRATVSEPLTRLEGEQ
ncbi:class C sortase [Salinibacterium sp. ZJ70]|uniref:class C sortase n=1 Tax=Salinibacterium sp. ZJ70 TaxID=2708084 RepID=UPI001CD7DA80|nr:class C sortase [Salinibacterium sp. ZJ70]